MYDCFKKGAFVSLPLFNRHTLLPYHDHDLYGRFVPLGLFLNRYIVNILGTRGLPAAHGGFETFAQHLSLDLMARGWAVHIYCQNNREDSAFDGDGSQDEWMGVKRTHFSSRFSGPLGTMDFDLKCVRHVLTQSGVDLVLGYNTAAFSLLQKLKRRRVIMNMDGIEWKRSGLVTVTFRSPNSFMRPFAQMPRGFCRLATSGGDADCRSRVWMPLPMQEVFQIAWNK